MSNNQQTITSAYGSGYVLCRTCGAMHRPKDGCRTARKPDSRHQDAPQRAGSPKTSVDALQPLASEVVAKAGKRRMNRTEGRYAAILQERLERQHIKAWMFEGIRLKWGEDSNGEAMRYLADFCITEIDGSMTLVETKGAKVWDRDRVRFKGCRAQWDKQFKFEMMQYDRKKGWVKIL